MVKCIGTGGEFFANLGPEGFYRFSNLPRGPLTIEVLQLDMQAAPGGAYRSVYEARLELEDRELAQRDIDLSQ